MLCYSRLYLLQGAVAQQEWRVAELLHRLQTYLTSHLQHPYKNIRDRIGRLAGSHMDSGFVLLACSAIDVCICLINLKKNTIKFKTYVLEANWNFKTAKSLNDFLFVLKFQFALCFKLISFI